jgi:signal transduction histidine kinase
MLLSPEPKSGRTLLVTVGAFAFLAVIFTLDAITPARMAFWPYGMPIMLAALTGSRRLTLQLVFAALFANAMGSVVDWVAGDVNWTPEYIFYRCDAFVSTLLVGVLTAAVQRSTAQAERVVALQLQNARELAVSAAADKIVTALSTDRVVPAIVTQAVVIFDAAVAVWVPAQRLHPVLVADGAGEDVRVISGGLADGSIRDLAGFLGREAQWLPMHPTLQSLGTARSELMLSIPISGAAGRSGVVFVLPSRAEADEAVLSSANSFARIAGAALEEARLLRELETRNEWLLERQQVIQDLVDAISHDVRTPLEALSMTFGQALAGEYGALPTPYEEVLRESRISIDDIYRLAETLLLVARFEAGSAFPEEDAVSVESVVDDLVAEFRVLAQARNVELRKRLESDAIVAGSQPNVRRAVANLIANAIRHTPPGGRVEVSVRRRERHVELTVDDDGFGLDASVRPMLFQRFARGVGTGTGLGLYIVRRVAESMGGTVRYEARDPRGSSFTLTLPAVPVAAVAAQ